MALRVGLMLLLATANAQDLPGLAVDDECASSQCALSALQRRGLQASAVVQPTELEDEAEALAQEDSEDGELDEATALAQEDDKAGAGCCSQCDGRFCSPKSGRCYDRAWRSYFLNCKAATHQDCCGGCNDFCSPSSGRCYTVKYKDYFKTCSSPPTPSTPPSPPIPAATPSPPIPAATPLPGGASTGASDLVPGRAWSSKAPMIKGICYGPVPLKSPKGGSMLHEDDWMAPAAKPMWGERGRADLKVISAMGANFVRLYGNDPNNAHNEFLDEAHRTGLQVAPGMSDHPYTQMAGSCKHTDYNCYAQVKELYLQNLQGVNCTSCGFLTQDKSYHPGLGYFSIINEPDLKMPPTATIGSFSGVAQMCKAIVSAFDAILDAEKEVGVKGAGINFTATFSFAVCKPCAWFKKHPALGQMAQLKDAMENPQKYGYTPRNNLAEAYRTRWTNSFNTQNKAGDLPKMVLQDYESWFTTTPVYIAEYHSTYVNETSDVKEILDIASSSNLMLGISYFEYQRAYWKGGTEEAFGMLGFGDYSIADMEYFGQTYKVWCLEPQWSKRAGSTQTAAVALAYGGSYLNATELCLPNPMSVPINADGYNTISKQATVDRMSSFVIRVVDHLGAVVVDKTGLESFAEQFVGDPSLDFGSMVMQIFYKPGWLRFSQTGWCLADRDSDATQIAQAIGYACGANATLFNCSNLIAPKACDGDIYATGDWIFSNFYMNMTGADPLQTCFFGGAAIYASPELYTLEKPECVAEAGPFKAAGKVSAEQAKPLRPVHTLGKATWDWKPSSTAQADKKPLGPSCALYGCINVYAPANRCQCNSGCEKHGSCCADYAATCDR